MAWSDFVLVIVEIVVVNLELAINTMEETMYYQKDSPENTQGFFLDVNSDGSAHLDSLRSKYCRY